MAPIDQVPLLFRAQVGGRCQPQRIVPGANPQDAEMWVRQWVERVYPDPPQIAPETQTRTYTLSWRLITNSGQDDSIIRPVIGARGWPFYPGSSMKGVFRRACTPAQAQRYCGGSAADPEGQPGLLRFHGGYPTDTRWTEGLLDMAHPQQERQVIKEQRTSAFALISLHRPELRFGLSSVVPLPDSEWETIWQIWERAMAQGIGGRVCAGYGQPETLQGRRLYAGVLKGKGQASKRLDGSGEFRPNMVRAGIRGHALRIFGGLTSAEQAQRLVNQLFGSVAGQGDVGLLVLNFVTTSLEMDTYGQGGYAQPTYNVQGKLAWLLTRPLPEAEERALKQLVTSLMQFALLLGGFGKSWRRADHRRFMPSYYDQGGKPLIGCHWEWVGNNSLRAAARTSRLERVPQLIERLRKRALAWMQLQGVKPQPEGANWREAWHPQRVEVWGRVAEEEGDCEAIRWLHGPYEQAMPRLQIREGSIYQSSLTGQMGQIGRLWHRMFPVIGTRADPDNPQQKIARRTPRYLELLTVFPDASQKSEQFMTYLDRQNRFQLLWPPHEEE